MKVMKLDSLMLRLDKKSEIEEINLVKDKVSSNQSSTVKRADPERYPVKDTPYGPGHSPIGTADPAENPNMCELWMQAGMFV